MKTKLNAIASWISERSLTRIVLPVFALFLVLITRDIVLALIRRLMQFQQDVPTIYLGKKGPIADNVWATSYSVFACFFLVVLGYLACRYSVKAIERRNVQELGLGGAGKELGIGTFFGVAMITVIVFVIWMCGSYNVHYHGQWYAVIASAAAALSAAFIEELVVRGIIFRVLERRLGTWITLLLTSLLFGLAHLGNENSSLFAAISIAATAGVVLGLAFVLTRRIWFAVGLHFAVNLTQGAILGMPVSGLEKPGIFVSKLDGVSWLTGGEFGIESSSITIVVALMIAVLFGIFAMRSKTIVVPFWKLQEP